MWIFFTRNKKYPECTGYNKGALPLAERTRKLRRRAAVIWLWRRRSSFPESQQQHRKKINMAPKVELPSVAAILWVILLNLIPPVEAYDAGDVLALLLGTILTVVGFCACLGWYARKRNDQLWWRGAPAHMCVTLHRINTSLGYRLSHSGTKLLPERLIRNVPCWYECVKCEGNHVDYLEEGGRKHPGSLQTGAVVGPKTVQKDCCSCCLFSWRRLQRILRIWPVLGVITVRSWCVSLCSVSLFVQHCQCLEHKTANVKCQEGGGGAAFCATETRLLLCEE